MFGNINDLFSGSSQQKQTATKIRIRDLQYNNNRKNKGSILVTLAVNSTNAAVAAAAVAAGFDSNDSLTQKDVDLLLAKELQSMSCQERTQCLEEMHGIISEQITTESVEQTTLALQQFDQQLYNYNMNIVNTNNNVSSNNNQHPQATSGYAKAVIQNTSSLLTNPIRNRSLKIQFLRAEKWNVTKAVQRMIKFFDFLDVLNGGTGNNNNNKRIFELPTIQDFNPHELEIVQEGSLQILPSRDAVGRQILRTVG